MNGSAHPLVVTLLSRDLMTALKFHCPSPLWNTIKVDYAFLKTQKTFNCNIIYCTFTVDLAW